jgi:hypothetical protein
MDSHQKQALHSLEIVQFSRFRQDKDECTQRANAQVQLERLRLVRSL